jgi:hypothetical protein
MKPFIGVVVSLTVALVGGLAFTHWAFTHWGDPPASETLPAPVRLSTPVAEAPGLRAAAEQAVTVTAPRADSTQRVETYQQDMATLRQEVTLLRQEVATLQRQLHAQQPMAPDTPQGREDTAARESRTDPTARAEEERAQHERIEVLEAAFWQEPTDQQWAGVAAAAVQGALLDENIEQITLQSLECRSHTCRVELAAGDTGELEKSLPLLVHQLGETLPYVTAGQVTNGANGTSLILYMSRDANDSPQQSSKE